MPLSAVPIYLTQIFIKKSKKMLKKMRTKRKQGKHTIKKMSVQVEDNIQYLKILILGKKIIKT